MKRLVLCTMFLLIAGAAGATPIVDLALPKEATSIIRSNSVYEFSFNIYVTGIELEHPDVAINGYTLIVNLDEGIYIDTCPNTLPDLMTRECCCDLFCYGYRWCIKWDPEDHPTWHYLGFIASSDQCNFLTCGDDCAGIGRDFVATRVNVRPDMGYWYKMPNGIYSREIKLVDPIGISPRLVNVWSCCGDNLECNETEEWTHTERHALGYEPGTSIRFSVHKTDTEVKFWLGTETLILPIDKMGQKNTRCTTWSQIKCMYR